MLSLMGPAGDLGRRGPRVCAPACLTPAPPGEERRRGLGRAPGTGSVCAAGGWETWTELQTPLFLGGKLSVPRSVSAVSAVSIWAPGAVSVYSAEDGKMAPWGRPRPHAVGCCGCALLCGKKDCADVIELKAFLWGDSHDYPFGPHVITRGLSRCGPRTGRRWEMVRDMGGCCLWSWRLGARDKEGTEGSSSSRSPSKEPTPWHCGFSPARFA